MQLGRRQPSSRCVFTKKSTHTRLDLFLKDFLRSILIIETFAWPYDMSVRILLGIGAYLKTNVH